MIKTSIIYFTIAGIAVLIALAILVRAVAFVPSATSLSTRNAACDRSVIRSDQGISDNDVAPGDFANASVINLTRNWRISNAVVPLFDRHCLRELSIARTGIDDRGIRLLADCTRLSHLDVSYCDLGLDGSSTIVALPVLESLSINGCHLSLSDRDKFSSPILKELYAARAKLDGFAMRAACSVTTLRRVSIAFVDADDDDVVTLIDHARLLTLLDVEGNPRVSSRSVGKAIISSSIEWINANGTGVSDDVLNITSVGARLQAIEIRNTAVSPEAKAAFRLRFKDVRVIDE